MTELKFEKRRRFPVLWTLLAIISVVVVVWIILDDNNSLFEENLIVVGKPESYKVESGFAEAKDWNGNDFDPWAGDTVWNENKVWGDDSDIANEGTPEENDNISASDHSEAFGTNPEAQENADRLKTDINVPDGASYLGTETESATIDNFIAFASDLKTTDLNRRTAHEGLSKLTVALMALTAKDFENSGGMHQSASEMVHARMSSMQEDKPDMNQQEADVIHEMGSGVRFDLRRLRQQTNQLKDSRMLGMQASVLRNSFMEAATIFQELQSKYYPNLQQDASEVMDAAQDVNAEDMASNQRPEIKMFFNEAADLLAKVKEQNITASHP